MVFHCEKAAINTESFPIFLQQKGDFKRYLHKQDENCVACDPEGSLQRVTSPLFTYKMYTLLAPQEEPVILHCLKHFWKKTIRCCLPSTWQRSLVMQPSPVLLLINCAGFSRNHES